ncbi:hypothetical protein [Streptomyces sp. NPDC048106]|uniref:hypothetical protein n=1 Tax=Streptomyces sp. NPDC048106 TaxID=3155750 RepID=UPI00345659E3
MSDEMSTTGAVPPDDTAMLAAYVASAERIVGLAGTLGDRLKEVRVAACPAWSGHDLLAHVTSVCRRVASPRPIDGGDHQQWIDREIAQRVRHSTAEVAEEFADLVPELEAVMSGRPAGALVVDLVTHEHDLRAALGGTFVDHSLGLHQALSATVAWVGGLKLVQSGCLTLSAPSARAEFGDAGAPTRVTFPDDWEMWRTLAVRRSREQLEGYPRSGDLQPLLDVTSRYPLPEQPLSD